MKRNIFLEKIAGLPTIPRDLAFDALALLAGLVFPFAFAPYGYAILSIICLAILFVLWRFATTPRCAAWRGYLFGLGKFGLGAWWVYISMNNYSNAGVLASSLLTLLFIAFLALYPALAGYLSARIFSRVSLAVYLLVVAPGLWLLTDWLHGWFLTGFPWLQLGYSQTDTPLAALAPLGGVYLVGWLAALLASALAGIFLLTEWQRRGLFILIVAVWTLCHQLQRISWTQPAGLPFTVASIQGNIPQNVKWQPEAQRATLQAYYQLTAQHWDARLIVWPETAVPAFHHQVNKTILQPLADEARQHRTDLLIGVPYIDLASERYYNALVSLGSHDGLYFKRHLVPFGEFLPLRPIFGFMLDLLDIPLADFAAGSDGQPLLEAAGYPLGATICYEDVFGAENLAALPAAAYLVNVSNDAWFGDSIAPHQHQQMARMRALETGRYMLRSTNTGITALIDQRGQVIRQAPQFQRTVLTGSITPYQGATPYVRLGGDGLLMGLAFAVLALACWSGYRCR